MSGNIGASELFAAIVERQMDLARQITNIGQSITALNSAVDAAKAAASAGGGIVGERRGKVDRFQIGARTLVIDRSAGENNPPWSWEG